MNERCNYLLHFSKYGHGYIFHNISDDKLFFIVQIMMCLNVGKCHTSTYQTQNFFNLLMFMSYFISLLPGEL